MINLDDDFNWEDQEDKPLDPELIKNFMKGAASGAHTEKSNSGKRSTSNSSTSQKPSVDLHWHRIPPQFRKGFEENKLEGQKNFLLHKLEEWKQAGVKSAQIIHGKGDGHLGEAVRKALENHPSVKRNWQVQFNREAGAATNVDFF